MTREAKWLSSIAVLIVGVSGVTLMWTKNNATVAVNRPAPSVHAKQSGSSITVQVPQVAEITRRAAAPDVPQSRAQIAMPSLVTPHSEEEIANAVIRSGARVAGLSVRVVEGIVVLKGSAAPTDIQLVSSTLRDLGVKRIANLMTTSTFDDEGIRRSAERQLTSSRALDGCKLEVSCRNGVVRVSGTVQNDLQVDAARAILRGLPGASDIRVELSKM